MSIVHVTVSQIVQYDWSSGSYKLHFSYRINTHDTYIVIFGPTQDTPLELLKNSDKVKILYIAPTAVNKNKGHGKIPRNTLVVFELASEADASSPTVPDALSTVPTV